VITGAGRLALLEGLPGESANGVLLGFPQLPIREVFVSDGTNQLQLTNFKNIDTADFGRSLSPDGERAFFTASADPFGTNPSKNCQLFTTDAFGGGLQQLTRFNENALSTNGCFYGRAPTGCAITLYNAFAPSQDARTGTVVFYSNCDPFTTNANGGQLFAIRPDGSGLRQLTQASGFIRQPDGSVTVELPGPYVYGPYR
jgi:Tol biopolymer transport system component